MWSYLNTPVDLKQRLAISWVWLSCNVTLLLFSHVYLMKVYVVISTRILEFFTSLLFNSLLNSPQYVTKNSDRGWNRTCIPIDINPFIAHPARGYFYVPHESEQWKSCEKGPMVFRPYQELAFDITILGSFHDNVGKSGNKCFTFLSCVFLTL